MSPHLLSAGGHEPQRHELVGPRRVVLDDADVGDASEHQPSAQRYELCLVGHGEHDGVRSLGEVARRRLASGMRDLSGLEATRQIGSRDDEVVERRDCSRGRYANRLSVASFA